MDLVIPFSTILISLAANLIPFKKIPLCLWDRQEHLQVVNTFHYLPMERAGTNDQVVNANGWSTVRVNFGSACDFVDGLGNDTINTA